MSWCEVNFRNRGCLKLSDFYSEFGVALIVAVGKGLHG